jgi:hypothetical protein
MSIHLNHGKLLKNLRIDAKVNGLSAVSRRIKIPYMTLYDIIKDAWDNKGTIRTWIQIEAYYKGRQLIK